MVCCVQRWVLQVLGPKAWEPNILDTIKEAGIKLNYSTSGYSEKTNTN